jgi:sulfhydrogenase subunit gamma (sulfur reductase)
VKNPYRPLSVQIEDIIVENEARDIKTFKLRFVDENDEKDFSYLPGQFAELSVMGSGECPIGIASSPTENGYLLFTVKRAGVVTTDLHQKEKGDLIGVRGPLGNTYPFDLMKGKNVLIIGGGFAFTTLRSTIKYVLEPNNRKQFKDVIVIYGARSPGELIYKDELWAWEKHDGMKMHITVDKGDETWQRREGFVPAVLRDVAPTSDNTIALVCGPPIMIKFTLPVLMSLGFSPQSIFLSLEMRMKCGIGKCGRCNIGHKYVCKDGPVFSFAQLQELPQEF